MALISSPTGMDEMSEPQGSRRSWPSGPATSTARTRPTVVVDARHPRAEVGLDAAGGGEVPAPLPHHARPQAGVVEALDEAGHHLAVTIPVAQEGVLDRGHQVEVLDALGGPRRRDLGARHAPHLLGVGPEEDLEEPASEAVGDPGIEGALVGGGKHLGVEVAGHDPSRLGHPQAPQGVQRAQRVVEETSAVVDPGHPAPDEQVAVEDLAPQGLDLGDLGEEAVAADVHAAALEDHAAGDAPHGLVGLEDDTPAPELAELEGGGQSGGAGADDDGLLRVGRGSQRGHQFDVSERISLADPAEEVRGRAPPAGGRRSRTTW